MIKSGIDQDALVAMFSEATAKQGEALRKAVSEATLKALQGTRADAGQHPQRAQDRDRGGLGRRGEERPADARRRRRCSARPSPAWTRPCCKTVEANRKALEQFVGQGLDVQEKQIKGVLANLEKMEDMFFATVGKAAQGAGQPLAGPWEQVLEAMKLQGHGHRRRREPDRRAAAGAGADRRCAIAAPPA